MKVPDYYLTLGATVCLAAARMVYRVDPCRSGRDLRMLEADVRF